MNCLRAVDNLVIFPAYQYFDPPNYSNFLTLPNNINDMNCLRAIDNLVIFFSLSVF